MREMAERVAYFRRFQAEATQLNSLKHAGQWWMAEVPLADAIAWANQGFEPEEALAEIAAGRTPLEIELDEAGTSTLETIAQIADDGRIDVRGVNLRHLD